MRTYTRQYPVQLTDDERAFLERFCKKGVAPGRKYTRARILLLVDESQATDEAIAHVLHVVTATVRRICKKYGEGGVEFALSERPRPGVPPRLTTDGEAALLTVAASEPPEGHPVWTMQLLADRLVTLGVVERISDETVRRTLKKTMSSPGRFRNG